jgi:hypothetical protein
MPLPASKPLASFTFSVAQTAVTRQSSPVRLYACPAWIIYADAPEISERNRAFVPQKIQTLFIDDLDGSEAECTVRFRLDGTEYEIDLNAKHTQDLRDALARYIAAGRRVGGAARRPSRGARRGSANGLNMTEVREWAKA